MTITFPCPVRQPSFGPAQVDVRSPVPLVERRGKDEAVAEIPEAVLQETPDATRPHVRACVGCAKETEALAYSGRGRPHHLADLTEGVRSAF